MVLNRNSHEKDNMPQTVPSAGFTPPFDYTSFATDCFDLSLLPSPASSPNDAELTLSPSSSVVLYPPATPSMFQSANADADYFETKPVFEQPNAKNFDPVKPQIFTSFYPNSPLDNKDEILDEFSSSNSLYSSYHSPYQTSLISNFKEEPINSYLPFCFPIQSPISPPSSCTSYSNHSSPIYPQSVSPVHTIKSEKIIDLQESLEEFKALQKQFEAEKLAQTKNEDSDSKTGDYQLLRQVLKDTSFQKKFNLKPFEFGTMSGFVDNIKLEEPDEAMPNSSDNDSMESQVVDESKDIFMTQCNEDLPREKIDPVLSLAFEQMQKEVNTTCSVLGIATDPVLWTIDNVKSWLLCTLEQFNLPPVQMEYFNMDGATLVSLSEEEFTQRAPQSGSILHAQLEIWKAACYEAEITKLSMKISASATTTTPNVADVNALPTTVNQINQQQNSNTWTTKTNTESTTQTASNTEISDDEDEEIVRPASGSSTKTATKGLGIGGGSHIHLWQFLKELLASPNLYGSAIRWLDRNKGVFKIEDSVRVARLWGKRKNRPAMNYDKLSRSIRQYYKKGIMKKTERSQRLVYQFCHPYCL